MTTNQQTETKHTPGPWRVGKLNGGAVHYAGGVPIILMPGNAEAIVSGENREANARLIASAPALVEGHQRIFARLMRATESDFLAAIQDCRAIAAAALRSAGIED